MLVTICLTLMLPEVVFMESFREDVRPEASVRFLEILILLILGFESSSLRPEEPS